MISVLRVASSHIGVERIVLDRGADAYSARRRYHRARAPIELLGVRAGLAAVHAARNAAHAVLSIVGLTLGLAALGRAAAAAALGEARRVAVLRAEGAQIAIGAQVTIDEHCHLVADAGRAYAAPARDARAHVLEVGAVASEVQILAVRIAAVSIRRRNQAVVAHAVTAAAAEVFSSSTPPPQQLAHLHASQRLHDFISAAP